MTNPGDSGDKPRSEHGDASSGSGYEPPPIEQSQGQSSRESQPGSSQPTSGYPPPSHPPSGGYPPPQGYPPSGSSASGYGAPPSYESGYQDTSGYGAPSYSSQSPYGTPQGGYPPPPSYSSGYGDYQGGYGAAPTGTNQLAIWSLVASLIGLLCGLGSIAGIVLGIVALNQIKRTRQAGYGLAVAGIIVGAASLVISLIWNIYAFSR